MRGPCLGPCSKVLGQTEHAFVENAPQSLTCWFALGPCVHWCHSMTCSCSLGIQRSQPGSRSCKPARGWRGHGDAASDRELNLWQQGRMKPCTPSHACMRQLLGLHTILPWGTSENQLKKTSWSQLTVCGPCSVAAETWKAVASGLLRHCFACKVSHIM